MIITLIIDVEIDKKTSKQLKPEKVEDYVNELDYSIEGLGIIQTQIVDYEVTR